MVAPWRRWSYEQSCLCGAASQRGNPRVAFAFRHPSCGAGPYIGRPRGVRPVRRHRPQARRSSTWRVGRRRALVAARPAAPLDLDAGEAGLADHGDRRARRAQLEHADPRHLRARGVRWCVCGDRPEPPWVGIAAGSGERPPPAQTHQAGRFSQERAVSPPRMSASPGRIRMRRSGSRRGSRHESAPRHPTCPEWGMIGIIAPR